MALTRKALSAMGIEETQADEIIKMHLETVNPLKDERDSLKSASSRLEAVQKELDDFKKQVKDSDRSPYKAKYEEAVKATEALQAEFDKFKADVDAQATLAEKKNAYRKFLVDAGVSEKRIDSVLRLAEIDGKFDSIEFEDGEVKGADEITKGIEEDYSDFIVKQKTTGAQTATPPSNNVPDIQSPSRATLLAQQYHANLYGEAK